MWLMPTFIIMFCASKPNVFGKILFNKKNYHVGDINLFYLNIRQNVKTRIGAFWKQH